MPNSVYSINKGINKPIEFKGLKAQYIGYLGAGLVGLLLLFAGLYILGIHMFICLGITFILGMLLFAGVYRYSDQYGQYGLLKKAAKRGLPACIRSYSRRYFMHLIHPPSK